MKVTGLSHVVLRTRNLEKMVAFYQDVLGLTIMRDAGGRMFFMTSDPTKEDHEIALTAGREDDDAGKFLAHIAWHVPTPADVKAYYDRLISLGVEVDHTVSHSYSAPENTVSCYFLDPDGNHLEVFAMVEESDPENRVNNRPLDLTKSVQEIIDQASGRLPAAQH